MLHLRNVRLSDVVLRNVAGLSNRSSHSGTDQVASDTHDGGEVQGFEFRPKEAEERPLTFRLPDLSKREEAFLKQQVRIVLRPDCLQQEQNSGKFGKSFLALAVLSLM